MKPLGYDDTKIGRSICPGCFGPVEVPFGARNYCRSCADDRRAFIAESADRHPKFGGDSVRVEAVSLQSEAA